MTAVLDEAGLDEAGLTCDAITRDYRIWQRRRGHRYSLDDVATAFQAVSARPDATRCLDLGCGIGSVLLMVAWKLSDAEVTGVEAQPVSAALARRSLATNGLEARCRILEGDLRTVTPKVAERFDLVSGTPPYLPVGTALASPDPQRAAARLELRGGVEDYLAAAARVLAPEGRVVVCADGRHPERVLRGAAACGLAPIVRRDAIARARAEVPLFSVWTLARADEPFGACVHERVVVRDESGAKTADAHAMRGCFGLA